MFSYASDIVYRLEVVTNIGWPEIKCCFARELRGVLDDLYLCLRMWNLLPLDWDMCSLVCPFKFFF